MSKKHNAKTKYNTHYCSTLAPPFRKTLSNTEINIFYFFPSNFSSAKNNTKFAVPFLAKSVNKKCRSSAKERKKNKKTPNFDNPKPHVPVTSEENEQYHENQHKKLYLRHPTGH
jgi:hypothetical protein